ncbi:ATP-dependent DNA ligase [Azohydromonas caseinilytica]|uniref:DNA ligase (ATP) n=1 Tax=Azohydromonas caseinilytica TaxID=2728836 RepID=A0A848F5A7_9BURK|nr:ATP-dependent DNA ligase [Azohydromonas caseinilytica]NML14794.1 ATP-dependent DNA ligase [Azohydromonas caseinilytica]
MRLFAQLYAELDARTATLEKVAALRRYLAAAPPADAAWALYFLAGGKPRQSVPGALLRAMACTLAGIPDWLFEESYQAVGDLAETIALVLPPPASRAGEEVGLAEWVETRLLPLRGQPPQAQARCLAQWWGELDTPARFLLCKLIGGSFRVGVSKLLVQRALAEHAGLDPKLMAQRMMGFTDAKQPPSAVRFLALLAADDGTAAPADSGQPYPFFLAHALEAPPQSLGTPADWIVEWKYDGIRAQVVRRAGQCWIWSRGEELVTERFPEVVALAQALPDGTVVDGEILAWQDGRPAPFARLQQRLNRKTLPRKLLQEAPVTLLAYDLLEEGGHDLRGEPLLRRRERLEALGARTGLPVSPLLEGGSWEALAAERAASRERGVEGLMLKQRAAPYGAGRTKAEGLWWKWKIEPMTVDGVLVYAQRGHGRRASVYTDYTFAVWSRPPADAAEAQAVVEAIARGAPAVPGALQLVPFTKAYSGLTDAEFAAVDRVIRAHTIEKFGPVRSVRPTLVFELGFEDIARSPRHKSGIALRFPRMLRLRPDKPLHEADTLATLQALLHMHGSAATDEAGAPGGNDDEEGMA